MASSSRPFAVATAALVDGWWRVIRFPMGLAALACAAAVITLPGAVALDGALQRQLGESAMAARVASGVDLDWWDEFRASGAPDTFALRIIGGAGPVGTYSTLLDGDGPAPSMVMSVVAAGLVWLFLSGGLLDRYARRRRVGTRGFFGASGVFFFRFLRLAAITGLVYAFLVGPFHTIWLGDVYGWLTRDVTVERTAFFWRVVFYAVWLSPLLLVNAIADYAKVRAVLEDRHSMIGALIAAARFIFRHPADVALAYGANALIAALVLAVYLLLAPDGRGGDWRLLAVVTIGAGYLVARLATRLAFLATALALVERRFAHAEYTAPPLPVWPDSPAAEAIENLKRAEFGVRSAE
jgi:hypothetical protein